MQAIATKFLAPSANRGARVVARAQAGRVTVGWDHSQNVDENHRRAAKALADKIGWNGSWVAGALHDGTGNVYVCVDRAHEGSFVVAGA